MPWNAKGKCVSVKPWSSLQLVKKWSLSKSAHHDLHCPAVADSVRWISRNEDERRWVWLRPSQSRRNAWKPEARRKTLWYFASIQLLRHNLWMQTNPDLADVIGFSDIIDEARTRERKPSSVTITGKELVREHTKIMNHLGHLSIFGSYWRGASLHTWDHVMEQQAKKKWELERPSEPNPYETCQKYRCGHFENEP